MLQLTLGCFADISSLIMVVSAFEESRSWLPFIGPWQWLNLVLPLFIYTILVVSILHQIVVIVMIFAYVNSLLLKNNKNTIKYKQLNWVFLLFVKDRQHQWLIVKICWKNSISKKTTNIGWTVHCFLLGYLRISFDAFLLCFYFECFILVMLLISITILRWKEFFSLFSKFKWLYS